jgi:aryl-alcohol dehydrogenase
MRIAAAISREGAAFPIIETVDLEEPRADEVLVRVVATGICHTDLRVQKGGGHGTPKPVVLGHEGAGIIERVGERVTGLAPGDHVVLSGSSCGECPSCRRNLPCYCVEVIPRSFGGSRPDGSSPISHGGEPIFASFFGQSSFAHFAVAEARSAVKVSKDIPLEILGPLGCGVITGAGAVFNSLDLRFGQSIAIFGVGSVGLSAVMAARIAGAARIIAIDVNAARLDLAERLGASDVIDANKDEPVASIRDITYYGADLSLNTTNTPDVYTQGLECLAMRGTAGFVTAPKGEWRPDMVRMLTGGRTLRSIINGDAAPQHMIPALIDYYRQGRFPFDELITFYPFEDIATAFEECEGGKVIKPVLRMPVTG